MYKAVVFVIEKEETDEMFEKTGILFGENHYYSEILT